MLLDLLFPGSCLLCGAPLFGEGAEPLCAGCRGTLVPIPAVRRCRICSLPLISEQVLCTRCRKRQYAFGRNLSVFEYRGPARELLYQYKFRNRRRLAGTLAGFLAPVLRAQFPGLVLVPVPASTSAVRRRGWDPVAVIARCLRLRHGFRVRRCLARRAGTPQKSLRYEQRLENLRGTVRLTGRGVPAPRLVLLDDVFTTGATANECAAVLLRSGARQVDVVSLALDVP